MGFRTVRQFIHMNFSTVQSELLHFTFRKRIKLLSSSSCCPAFCPHVFVYVSIQSPTSPTWGGPKHLLSVSPCQSVDILVFRPHQERRYQSTSIWFLFPVFLCSHAKKAGISWANSWKTILFWFTTLRGMSLFLMNKYLKNKRSRTFL